MERQGNYIKGELIIMVKEKGDILFDLLKNMSINNIKLVLDNAAKDIALTAKKEVFDDIQKLFEKNKLSPYEVMEKLKKKHLTPNSKKGSE